MHDIRAIRDNPELLDQGLKRRGLEPISKRLLELDGKRRATQTTLQELLHRRNDASRKIGTAKQKGDDATALIAKVLNLKDEITVLEVDGRVFSSELYELLARLPNLPASDVPDGLDESANKLLRVVGECPSFDYAPKQHYVLGQALGMMDFESASKLSGARFVVLKGGLAKLERALAAFMLDMHTTEYDYLEVSPPILVRDDTMFGTGQLPKFVDDLFRTTNGYWLIPTAEVPLTALAADRVIDACDLPIRVTAHTPCFRSEAGAAGKDTRGMIRQHQFNKVELVSITHADESDVELERMTNCAEEVLKRLGLAYRVVTLCAGDMGFSAHKTYDIEVWLPGEGMYREISSCSNCGEFQARRMNGRFKVSGKKGTRFVHTLNGSGLAIGRTLIAILENFQQEDGSIILPEALVPYMNGQNIIANDTTA